MSRLIYVANTSLDGFIEDDAGNFDWGEPTEEVHAFINDLVRPVGTHLYGRRMYETMRVWETDPSLAVGSPITADFAAIWQAADKVVYTTTLTAAETARTRIEHTFDASAVQHLKETSASDLMIGGAALAAEAFRAGLVDECQLRIAPIALGAGKRALPAAQRIELDLLEHRRFDEGSVYVRYSVRN